MPRVSSLGRDGLVFTEFFLNYTRQVLEMAVCPDGEKKRIPWLALPGYPLFLELYTPLLHLALLDSVSAAAGVKKRPAAAAVVAAVVSGAAAAGGGHVAGGQGQPPPPPAPPGRPPLGKCSDAAALEQRWADKFAPQEQPQPSPCQVAQVVEMGFSRGEALLALACTATVSSEFVRAMGAADASGTVTHGCIY